MQQPLLAVSPVSNRWDLWQVATRPHWASQRAVEVGTDRGEWAAKFLTQWPGHLTCIDPWIRDYDPRDLCSQRDRTDDEVEARRVLSQFGHRCKIIKQRSMSVVHSYSDGSFEFVHIDGDHTQAESDIYWWWLKVRRGGVLAGHDFLCQGEVDGGHGSSVQRAVLSFAIRNQLTVYLVVESDCRPWSFYMVKP